MTWIDVRHVAPCFNREFYEIAEFVESNPQDFQWGTDIVAQLEPTGWEAYMRPWSIIWMITLLPLDEQVLFCQFWPCRVENRHFDEVTLDTLTDLQIWLMIGRNEGQSWLEAQLQ